MKKVNITKITFITIDCDKCENSFRVYVNEDWKSIQEMKINKSKDLMFSCPHCDHSFIQRTDFSSICNDKDQEDIERELMNERINKMLMDQFKQVNKRREDDYLKIYEDTKKYFEKDIKLKWSPKI